MCPASCSAVRRELGLAGGAGPRTAIWPSVREDIICEGRVGWGGVHPLNSHRYLCLSQRDIMCSRISSTEMFND